MEVMPHPLSLAPEHNAGALFERLDLDQVVGLCLQTRGQLQAHFNPKRHSGNNDIDTTIFTSRY